MLIGDILSFTAARRADETALVFEGRSWTFAELDREVRRLAHGLARLAAPGDRVAILTENHPEYIAAYYGVPAAGMALVFLNRVPRRVLVVPELPRTTSGKVRKPELRKLVVAEEKVVS